MLRSLVMALTICVTGAVCAPTQAAFVVFAGNLSHGGAQNRPFSGSNSDAQLIAYFSDGAGPASITSAVLTAGSGLGLHTWTFGLGDLTPSDAITMTSPSTDNVNAFIDSNTVVSTSVDPSLSFGGLDLNLDAVNTAGSFDSSDWQTIYNANHDMAGSVSGNITLGGKVYNFSGAAVPEPGSIALLSGLGLVFGAVRRRRQTRATAV